MAARNDITGAEIKSGILSKQGRENWDYIFRKQTAEEWRNELYPSVTILDPDGVAMDTRINRADFERRFLNAPVHAMSYNLFLDDQHDPAGAYLHDAKKTLLEATHVLDWVIVRSYEEFVSIIKQRGVPDRVSFDHDLHFEHIRHFVEYTMTTGYIEYANFSVKTGKHCAEYLVNTLCEIDSPAPICYIHSANHVGRKEIAKVLYRRIGNSYTS